MVEFGAEERSQRVVRCALPLIRNSVMQMKSLLIALMGMVGLWACSLPRGDVPQPLYESSTSFDLENVRPFLMRVSGMIDSGFGEAEVDQVMGVINALAWDEETEFSFVIVHAGSESELRLTAFADDIDVADVAFFSSKPLAEAIDAEMWVFFDDIGM